MFGDREKIAALERRLLQEQCANDEKDSVIEGLRMNVRAKVDAVRNLTDSLRAETAKSVQMTNVVLAVQRALEER